ncbi:MAG: single-stranded DNA-binding protein [Bacteroidales bacterium]|nr:single-stranded DNA-binding protein [Candidatus Cacconaster caballi]
MSVNKVILIGNVGKDPEIRHLESGTAVATITLATSERYKDKNGEQKEVTEWHTVIAWRQLADLAQNYIRKGTQLYVEGRIRTRSWDDQNGQKRYATEIQADSIQLLGRRSDNPAQGAGTAAPSYSAAPRPAPAPAPTTPVINPQDLTDEGTDDLPF